MQNKIDEIQLFPAKIIEKGLDGWIMNVGITKNVHQKRLFPLRDSIMGHDIALKNFNVGDYLMIGIGFGPGLVVVNYIKFDKKELEKYKVYNKYLEK